MSTSLKMGDMYACQKCTAQIQVIQACGCDTDCADLQCCGQPMENITEPTVRADGDTAVNDGFEKR